MAANLPLLWREDPDHGALVVIVEPDGRRLTLRVENRHLGTFREGYFFNDGTSHGGRCAAVLRDLADWLDGT